MSWLETYILTWKLPVSLLVAALAILCIRNAYRKVRIGDLDMLDNGAVEQAFMASLWVGIGAIIYPYISVLLLGVWISFSRKHLMTLRAWMASVLAIALCALWFCAIHFVLPLCQ